MPSRTLVTGFGPFRDIAQNPSSLLAGECGRTHELLEVSYGYVRRFLRTLPEYSFDRLLLMGVNAGAPKLHLEVLGHNRMGIHPDVSGLVPDERAIWHDGPTTLSSTLWEGRLTEEDWLASHATLALSHDAGDYLCNFALFEALRLFPHKRVGFLHVPSETTLSLEDQLRTLEEVLRHIER